MRAKGKPISVILTEEYHEKLAQVREKLMLDPGTSSSQLIRTCIHRAWIQLVDKDEDFYAEEL